jgi:hypothetical protein
MMDSMLDYTQAILDGEFDTISVNTNNNEECEIELDPLELTVNILRRRPDIRDVILQTLQEFIVPWGSDEEEPEDYVDKQLLNAIKLDPFIHATITECLLGLADCRDEEGEEVYYPSIFDTDDAQEICSQLEVGGFREGKDPIPAKYSHLDAETLDLIYTHPDARQVLSRLPAEAITKEIVKRLCS